MEQQNDNEQKSNNLTQSLNTVHPILSSTSSTHYSNSHHVEATAETCFFVATLLEDTIKAAGSGPLAHRPFRYDDSLSRPDACTHSVKLDSTIHS